MSITKGQAAFINNELDLWHGERCAVVRVRTGKHGEVEAVAVRLPGGYVHEYSIEHLVIEGE